LLWWLYKHLWCFQTSSWPNNFANSLFIWGKICNNF
jgi:hypothetical protein